MNKFLATVVAVFVTPLVLLAGELTVTGVGSVSVPADNAYVSMSVVTDAVKPADALNMNSEATNRVFASLAKLGIKKNEMQTRDLSLRAKYNYPEKGQPKLEGYTVTHTIQITVCNLPDTGKVVDAVVKDGANRIDGISFGLSQDKLKDATNLARKQAAKDATDKLELYCNCFNVKIRELKSFSEYTSSPGRMAYTADRAAVGQSAAPTNVEGGDITIRIQVNTTWDTK
jgi:uncharacterized protein YggE